MKDERLCPVIGCESPRKGRLCYAHQGARSVGLLPRSALPPEHQHLVEADNDEPEDLRNVAGEPTGITCGDYLEPGATMEVEDDTGFATSATSVLVGGELTGATVRVPERLAIPPVSKSTARRLVIPAEGQHPVVAHLARRWLETGEQVLFDELRRALGAVPE